MEDPGRAEHDQSLHSNRWKHHTRSRCRRRYVTDQLLGKAVIRAVRERVKLQDPETEFALLRESLGVSRIAGSRPHNLAGSASCRNLRQDWTAVSRTALPGSHRGQHDTSDRPELGSKERETSLHQHVWRLTPQPNRASRLRSKTQFGQAFSRSRSWRRASLRSSRQLPPPISGHLTVISKQRRSCLFRR